MKNFVIAVYLSEIEKQCMFALNAVQSINRNLENLKNLNTNHKVEERTFLQNEIFRSVHSFLTHTSNISKMFWPSRPRKKKNETDEEYDKRIEKIEKVVRSRKLKEVVSISEKIKVLRSRTLRNHLEHFDERLDKWHKKSVKDGQFHIVQDIIGPKNAISGIDEKNMMRWFDNTTMNFLFRGNEYSLQELATGVDELLPKVRDAKKEKR